MSWPADFFHVLSFLFLIRVAFCKGSKLSKHFNERNMEQKNKGWKKMLRLGEKEGLIGGSNRPPSCPSPRPHLYILPSSRPSVPPSAGNRTLFWRGGDEEIKRKLHQVLVFDKTRSGDLKLQTTFEKTRAGVREKGWTRVGQKDAEWEKDRKGHLGFEIIVDEGRETERGVN